MKLSKRILNLLIIGYLFLVIFVITASIKPIVRLNLIKIPGMRLDHFLHFLLFIPWMVLAYWRWARNDKKRTVFLMVFGVGFILAGFTEVIQLLVPSRSFSINDLAANSLGIVFGAFISGWGRFKTIANSQ